MIRRLVPFLVLVLLGAALPAGPAAAQSSDRCFTETGFCISGTLSRLLALFALGSAETSTEGQMDVSLVLGADLQAPQALSQESVPPTTHR